MALAVSSRVPPVHGLGTPVALDGGTLVAHAMRQTRPDVVAAYPITPQTVITEAFSQFVANGEVHTEFVPVESEHAALSVCIGAAAAGARAQTATSGPGLALMWELLGVASGMRLPIVMHLCTRALSAPINILCDHSDAMAMRDTGWLLLFSENGQEAYDQAIIAVRLGEHPQVLLPVANVLDGFIVTHCVERALLLPDEVVSEFVGEYQPAYALLDLQRPVTVGGLDFQDFHMEHKRGQVEAMARAKGVLEGLFQEFAEISGRIYRLVEPYRLADAEVGVVVLGSTAGTVRYVVDRLRARGVRAGMLSIRSFRPFPALEVAAALAEVKAVGVLDRALAPGASAPPLFSDIASALAGVGLSKRLLGWVYGIGGREVLPQHIEGVFHTLADPSVPPGLVGWLGLREGR
ncbi:Pyruvate synthase subunit PorA [bacterium HR23]|nr:Pyruvate synthase subunit PorA [bacterium HR23]